MLQWNGNIVMGNERHSIHGNSVYSEDIVTTGEIPFDVEIHHRP